MNDLEITISRLRRKAERSTIIPRNSWKPAFFEAMEVIDALQAENTRLLQAVADGGMRAGGLQGKLVDAERRLTVVGKAMVEAAAPLEAMMLAGTDKYHGADLQEGIADAVAAVRRALPSLGPVIPPAEPPRAIEPAPSSAPPSSRPADGRQTPWP